MDKIICKDIVKKLFGFVGPQKIQIDKSQMPSELTKYAAWNSGGLSVS